MYLQIIEYIEYMLKRRSIYNKLNSEYSFSLPIAGVTYPVECSIRFYGESLSEARHVFITLGYRCQNTYDMIVVG